MVPQFLCENNEKEVSRKKNIKICLKNIFVKLRLSLIEKLF